MTGIGYQISFWVVAALAVFSTLAVVLIRHPLKAAFYLVGSFFATAAAFLMLDARLVAVFQILVYAGAIMVFIIFVIMLINLKDTEMQGRKVSPLKGTAVAITSAVTAALLALGLGFHGVTPVVGNHFGQVDAVAEVLYTNYAFAFEALSLLLLIAVIGAVVLTGKRDFTKD